MKTPPVLAIFRYPALAIPNSLVIAFTAQYAGRKSAVDYSEIMEADWFSKENFPLVPPKISIARGKIDWFSEQ